MKKCYFGDYRFSEDLDFSALGTILRGEQMERAVSMACDTAAGLLDEHAPVEIIYERYVEREPHPAGQEAFIIRARLPWQHHPQTRIMIEITMDEKLFRPIESRSIIHEYGESLTGVIQVYSLEEMIAEKLRAILQHVAMFRKRGWSRSRARDYYDIWRVLGTYKDRMDLTNFNSFLQKKCALQGVLFANSEDFFEDRMLAYVDKTWDQWLGPLVPGLPTFDALISELRPQIAHLVNNTG